MVQASCQPVWPWVAYVCHRLWPRERRYAPHVFGGKNRVRLLLAANLADNHDQALRQRRFFGDDRLLGDQREYPMALLASLGSDSQKHVLCAVGSCLMPNGQFSWRSGQPCWQSTRWLSGEGCHRSLPTSLCRQSPISQAFSRFQVDDRQRLGRQVPLMDLTPNPTQLDDPQVQNHLAPLNRP